MTDPTLSPAELARGVDRYEVYYQSGGWAQLLVVLDNLTNGQPSPNWGIFTEGSSDDMNALASLLERVVASAREDEREACAKIAEEPDAQEDPDVIPRRIRARGAS